MVANNILANNAGGISFRITSYFLSNPVGHHELSRNKFDGNTYGNYSIDTGIVELLLALTEDIAP
jgi:hypothetical protein